VKISLKKQLNCQKNQQPNLTENKVAELNTKSVLVTEGVDVFTFNFFDILESEEDEDKPIGGWGKRPQVAEKPKEKQAEKPKKEVKKSSLIDYFARKYPKTKQPGLHSFNIIDKKEKVQSKKQNREHKTITKLDKQNLTQKFRDFTQLSKWKEKFLLAQTYKYPFVPVGNNIRNRKELAVKGFEPKFHLLQQEPKK
jgi:hypothetical protein